MNKTLFFALSIILIGCSDKSEEQLLNKVSERLHDGCGYSTQLIFEAMEYDSIKYYPLKEAVTYVDSSYNELRIQIKNQNNSDQISSLIQVYQQDIQGLFEEDNQVDYTINEIPTTNSVQYGLIELSMFTKDALLNFAVKIGADDVKFDKLRIFVEYPSTEIKLGESFKGKLYYSAVSNIGEGKLQFRMNGDTVPSNTGIADFSYTPSRRGKESVKFEIIPQFESVYNQQEFLEQTIDITVK
jgi:hypothetical protein